MDERDEHLLRRSLRLAMKGRGDVEPNPMVGCVLARDGRVIGEGIHARFGGPHAEPTALASCTEDPRGATAYVTLEPCCHTNKKTPPCAPRLIAAGIARVVIGCLDPNPDVNGNGVRMLRDAGITVDPAPDRLASEFRQLIAPFIALTSHRRPYVTLKWAETADGKVAGANGKRLAITGPQANRAVHQLRTRCDAIVVGVNTVLVDDPSLTVRHVPVKRTPRRIILDRTLRTPLGCKLLTDAAAPTEIWTTHKVASELQAMFEPLPTNVRIVEKEAVNLDWHFDGATVSHVLVEPGPTLAAALLPTVDRLWVFRSNRSIAEPTAPAAPPVPSHYMPTGQIPLEDDVLIEYLNAQSPAFFAPVPSADFVIIQEQATSPSD